MQGSTLWCARLYDVLGGGGLRCVGARAKQGSDGIGSGLLRFAEAVHGRNAGHGRGL